MAKEFYQIEWHGSGETDVFASKQDARDNYPEDNEQWILDWVENGGNVTEAPDESANWSEAAKAKRDS